MLDQANYDTIRFDRTDDGVVIATLNRPERLNAVNGRMHTELSTIARDFDDDRAAKVLVLTGEGRAFSAGGDFSGGKPPAAAEGTPERPPGNMMLEARRIVDNLLECRKPIISAVNGYAMGLGATVALLCDIVVAGRSAVFADTHVKLGIGAGDGGQVIWPFLMGVNRAKYYLMTGDRLTGEEAERLGLVNFLVEDDELVAKATEIATRLAKGPLQAIIASKVPINQWLRSVSAQVLPLSLAMEDANMHTADAKEASRAFVEKREPNYTGR
jgi:enoyl-CoA hydratase